MAENLNAEIPCIFFLQNIIGVKAKGVSTWILLRDCNSEICVMEVSVIQRIDVTIYISITIEHPSPKTAYSLMQAEYSIVKYKR